MTAEIRLILIGLFLLAGLGGVLYWNSHERGIGAVGCKQDDLDAAHKQLEQQAKDLATYQVQLEDAREKLDEANRLLGIAASQPVPHLVCHQANPKPMSPVPGPAQGSGSAAGVAGEVHGSDFDPGPDLRRLSVGYERRVNEYRDALNQWPSYIELTHERSKVQP